MSEIPNSQILRFHCFADGEDFHLARAKKIECPKGHQLSYDFPKDAYWNYCCDCDLFSLSELSNKTTPAEEPVCQTCERPIVRRLLCNICNMIAIETNECEQPKSIENDEAPPECPGCLTPRTSSLSLHSCSIASFSYVTARARCPFCHKAIEPSPNTREAIFPEPDDLDAPEQAKPSFNASSDRKAGPNFASSSEAFSPLGLIIGVAGYILTIVSLLMVVLPPARATASRQWGRFRNQAPIVQPIECAGSVVVGDDLLLTAYASDPDREQLKFAWSIAWIGQSEKGGRIENLNQTGDKAVFHTDGIFPLADPVKVIIRLVVSDKYETVQAPPHEVLVFHRQNHPPVIEEPPQCSCENSEVRAGGSISLRAFATDEDEDDNDNLVYTWRSSIQTIPITNVSSKHGSTVILSTVGMDPQSSGAPLKVTLTVSDGHSRPEQREITIMVLPKEAPRKLGQTQLPVQPVNHPPRFEKFSVSKNLVEEGENVELRAWVVDPEGNTPLFYKWTTSAGAIQPNDDTATLNTSGIRAPEVEVTLAVSDSNGPPTVLRTSITIKPRPVKTALPSPNVSSTPELAKPLLFILKKTHWQGG